MLQPDHVSCMSVTCIGTLFADCSLHTDVMFMLPPACLYALPVLPRAQTSPVCFTVAFSVYYDHA